MLVLKLGMITSPIPLDCSGCSAITMPGDPVYVTENDVARAVGNELTINEYATWCPTCYGAIKSAAIKFNLPIEWDIEVKGRYVPESAVRAMPT